MRFTRGYKSQQVDDRRGEGPAAGGGGLSGGGANLLGALFRRFGLPGVLAGAALLYFTGGLDLGSGAPEGSRSQSGAARAPSAELASEPVVEFVSFVFDDAQNTWKEQFARDGKVYQLARLELFRASIQSACGLGEAAMGPFYCPGDSQVYIDLAFYEDLKRRLGAPGDFAQAYVIAHEVGHHVQHLLGDDERVQGAPRSQQAGDRGLLVRLELQADCYAGVWAHGTDRRDLLEAGDVEEALNAASKIGDDALQRKATGRVRPESFTHGTSAQRQRWFQRGFSSGQRDACDTFAANPL
ncbi:MAG: neutral zinc metallopeptidase [Deltaproteobacteria bacterium]